MYKLKEFLKDPRYKFTVWFILINVAYYAFNCFRFGVSLTATQAYEAGGFASFFVEYDFEIYRFITANFVHFSLLHILVNMISMWNIGRLVETIYSRRNYLYILAGSALGTTCFTYLIYIVTDIGRTSVSAGASGVVCGLMGVMLYLSFFQKNIYYGTKSYVLQNMVIMILFSFTLPVGSFIGHVGGLIGGFIAAYYIDLPNRLRKNNNKYN